MTNTTRNRILLIVTAIGLLGIAGCQSAAPDDYRFEIAQQPVRTDSGSSVAVRLVRTPSGQAVTDAELFERSSEIAPHKWPTPTRERLTPLVSDGRGNHIYTRRTAFRPGETIKLLAKASGERIRGDVRVGE